MTGDITPLVGRRFVAKSWNVCHVKRLGDGAARITWKKKPSDDDIKECTAWAKSVLGDTGDINLTVCMDHGKEKEALAAWRATQA